MQIPSHQLGASRQSKGYYSFLFQTSTKNLLNKITCKTLISSTPSKTTQPWQTIVAENHKNEIHKV
ncbi:MAG TPA: hypothetical protein DCM62_06470 [Bacteroidales bacterium]|nr:hypothetical protein [Bacteroidales bacterium]